MRKIKYISAIMVFVAIAFSCSSSDDDSSSSDIKGIVTTLAGSTVGYADGSATTAQFYSPQGLRVDNNGDLIVADALNHKIRKVTMAGMVTTIAGSTSGFLDDAAFVARFNTPSSVCIDASGNIFVADTYNYKMRKIAPTGYVSTFAGSTQGFADGTGTTAKFDDPIDCCFDKAGNMYVTDKNQKIRKITPAGVVTTFAGSTTGYTDGTGAAAQFDGPAGICSDSAGNLYVADCYNGKIRKITKDGVVTTIAGSTQGYADGTGSAAKFNYPTAITRDSKGNLYVADYENDKIRKITPAGVVTTLAGSTYGFSDGTGPAAQFKRPYGICFYKGKLYVSDNSNNKIRVIE